MTTLMQFFRDTPATLAIKYSWARQNELHGVAIWNSGDVDYNSHDGHMEEMWDALAAL